jgi:hypothetical protein
MKLLGVFLLGVFPSVIVRNHPGFGTAHLHEVDSPRAILLERLRLPVLKCLSCFFGIILRGPTAQTSIEVFCAVTSLRAGLGKIGPRSVPQVRKYLTRLFREVVSNRSEENSALCISTRVAVFFLSRLSALQET